MSERAPEHEDDGAGTPYEVTIERGKIREFAAAMQSTSPSYQGAAPIIPPTFLITAPNWATKGDRAKVGLNRRYVLHGEQEFRFFGPLPRAGDVLQAVERVAERHEKTGSRGGTMRFVVVVTEFRDESGRLAAEARCTMIEKMPKAAG
jgi:hypothetical protein